MKTRARYVEGNEYANMLSKISEEFRERFHDFKDQSDKFDIFSQPFNIQADSAPTELQMELIDLQNDRNLKPSFRENSVIDFYKLYLPRDKYPNLYLHAIRIASLFGTTYLCEQLFSKMNFTKSKFRSRLTDDHLQDCLRIATSSIRPDIEKIVKESQCQRAH